MAREVLSFVLDVNTKGVKSGLDKAGKGFVSMGKMARSSLAGIAQGLRSTGAGIQVLDHAMGAFNKLREMATFFFGTFINASLEMRAENDKQRKDLERMGAELKKLAGAIGDLLIPLILGIGDAFLPAISEAGKFLKTNKKQIGSGIVEHLIKLATAISEGIAPALVLASKAFSGLSILVDSLTAAGAKFASAYVGSIAAVLRGVERLNRAMGREGAAKAAADAAKENEELARSYDEVGNMAMGEILQIDNGQKQLEASINGFADALEKRVGQAGVAAMRRYGQAVTAAKKAAGAARAPEMDTELGMQRQDQELAEMLAERERRVASAAQREAEFQALSAQRTEESYAAALANEQRLMDAKIKTGEEQERLQSEAETASQEQFTRLESMANTTKDFLLDAVNAFKQGGIKALGEMLKNWAIQMAASAAIRAFAGFVSGSFAGKGVGAVLGKIFGLQAGGPAGYNAGGFVSGPTGIDRVPAMLTAGEYVLPKGVVDGIRNGTPPAQAGQFNSGGMVSTGAGTTHIHLPPMETIARPIAADNERYYRQHVVPAVEHLQRVGLLPG
jgi:hypothetical protein